MGKDAQHRPERVSQTSANGEPEAKSRPVSKRVYRDVVTLGVEPSQNLAHVDERRLSTGLGEFMDASNRLSKAGTLAQSINAAPLII